MTNFSSTTNCQDIPLVPKQEILDYDFASQSVLPTDFGDNVASSSSSSIRSAFIGMGFQPSLVNRVIEEKGEDDFDLLLDLLVAYNEGPQRANSESSDSLEDLFGDEGPNDPPEISTFVQPKEEPDVTNNVEDSKRSSLLLMNFSLEEINFAMNKLGKDAPIDGLVDFIVAAQIAKRLEEAAEDIVDVDEKEKIEEISNDILFSTMDKSLHLLEMGFSDSQVSWAIEKCGSELSVSELANSIFMGRPPVKKVIATDSSSSSFPLGAHSVKPETEGLHSDTPPQQTGVNLGRSFLGKKPKPENADDIFETVPRFGTSTVREEIRKGKRPKQEHHGDDDSNLFPDPIFYEEKLDPDFDYRHETIPQPMIRRPPRKPLTGLVAKPPYFLYGNIGDMSHEYWLKISKFLYHLEPEFVNAHHFSALNRSEGYIHNLPTEDRFEIDPKPPMSIEEAMPHAIMKWWPAWDPRKRLDCVSSEVNGVSQLCDRLGKTMNDSRGILSPEQQRNILHHCRSLNLVWIGRNRVGPIEPKYLESILGYPANHTDEFDSLTERLESLKHSFQPDTLGYHLSVLKSMYPGGLTVLSVFSGIGGAEIALHKLGVGLKAVVSVESSETKRKILKKWWESSGQRGELVQIGDIQKLTSSRLSGYVEKFGCFDFVICQSPCSSSETSKGAVAVSSVESSISGFDFSQFCEFSRILQRVRVMGDKRR